MHATGENIRKMYVISELPVSIQYHNFSSSPHSTNQSCATSIVLSSVFSVSFAQQVSPTDERLNGVAKPHIFLDSFPRNLLFPVALALCLLWQKINEDTGHLFSPSYRTAPRASLQFSSASPFPLACFVFSPILPCGLGALSIYHSRPKLPWSDQTSCLPCLQIVNNHGRKIITTEHTYAL